ncbi:MarR family winged helix-turn-helix transcriptional regulator [Bradyrhizobium sp. SYSU BS000235]|uniref:MarR family winged helix-turn-helix transcriptional regulator n=1 Tax=Bradyrhizobium sp. SYSU BS000235 TaxID=3411332 RepID=UPI003C748B84
MATSSSIVQAELGLLVLRLARIWRRRVDQALAEHEISEAMAHPLRMLSRAGKGVRQGVLADELGIEGPSLVRIIDLLAAEGLVERQEDPTDRRAKVLQITPRGEAKVEEILKVMRKVRAELYRGISADDLAVTFDVLRRIENTALRSLEVAEAVDA